METRLKGSNTSDTRGRGGNAAENKRGQKTLRDENLSTTTGFGTHEDILNVINKVLARKRDTAETFLQLPVYRSLFFPVFFGCGIRRYNRRNYRYGPVGGTPITEDDRRVRKLAQALYVVGDQMPTDPDFVRLIENPSSVNSPKLTYGDIFCLATTRTHFLPLSFYVLNIFRRRLRSALRSLLEMLPPVIHSHLRHATEYLRSRRVSSRLSRSHNVPSLSQTTSPENKTFTRSQSLPDMLLKSSFEEFTPDIIDDEDDETYRFQCSCPGLYQCSVTGLVFHMEGEGDLVYRTVPWDRRLLAQHHKKPAGPLFDIKCLQQSVCQLHLPHCEIRSTGGCEFLSVAHVNDEGIEFIVPQKITETHVVINITGFSAFGNVKDEDSPPVPVRALVLLFYRPPADPDPESLLNVLLLPKNVVIPDVLRARKRLVGNEIYIETSSQCKLSPNQEYTLSMCPEDDSVLVQPTEAEFDCDNYDNYIPSFQVILEKIMRQIKLFLRENGSSKSVWERRVCLSSTAVKRSCGPSALNLPPNDRLLDIRSSFINGISGPVLKSLLDKLLEKTVLTDSERESADEIQIHRDKARFVVDTVRKKGEAASSEMIEFLFEVDPFLCEHLGLI